MLQNLQIKDFAIIDNLIVDFEDGMSVLTGETGAGKSIIIDAIGLLFGDRASAEMVRHGSKKAVVEGLFYITEPNTIYLLSENGIEVSDNQVIVYREISSTKSLARINGQLVTIQLLKEFSYKIADIHVQHDTQRIITPKNYINLIDTFDYHSISPLINIYQEALSEYKKSLKEYKLLIDDKQSATTRFDILNFQLNEIEELGLVENEDDDLLEQRNKLSNYNKIHQSLKDAYECLENSKFKTDDIYSAALSTQKASEYITELVETSKNIESAYYTLDDAVDTIRQQLNSLEYNPTLLNKIESRLYAINTLKRKLVIDSVNEIIEYHKKIKVELSEFVDVDALIEKKRQNILDKFVVLKQAAENLTEMRINTAKDIEASLLAELVDLQLKNVIFKIEIDTPKLSEDQIISGNIGFKEFGAEQVEFMLSTNKGTPPKPLLKVASGGEMSRIMLALKKLLLAKQSLSLIIFDEIDTGVSGEVAKKIANKMKDISKNAQVLCVSHLPQVVAVADNHLHVTKNSLNEGTSTSIKVLEFEERVTEIARMLGGDSLTDVSYAHAKELLKN